MSNTESATDEVTRDTAAALAEATSKFSDTMGSTTSTASEIGEVVTDVSAAARGFGDGLAEAVEATVREEFGNGVAGTVGTAATVDFAITSIVGGRSHGR
jgi:hypothetical protein